MELQSSFNLPFGQTKRLHETRGEYASKVRSIFRNNGAADGLHALQKDKDTGNARRDYAGVLFNNLRTIDVRSDSAQQSSVRQGSYIRSEAEDRLLAVTAARPLTLKGLLCFVGVGAGLTIYGETTPEAQTDFIPDTYIPFEFGALGGCSMRAVVKIKAYSAATRQQAQVETCGFAPQGDKASVNTMLKNEEPAYQRFFATEERWAKPAVVIGGVAGFAAGIGIANLG